MNAETAFPAGSGPITGRDPRRRMRHVPKKRPVADIALAAAAIGAACVPAHGDEASSHHHAVSGHAPIGVMGDHLHKQGEWMVSYRYMRMRMAGSRDGADPLSPEEIATSATNRFFGEPMQPPTLRVVPVDMTMNMHMFGLMYGLTDRVTLTAMSAFVTNEMDHVTFEGPAGIDRLGHFSTRSSGFGDTTLGALIGLDTQGAHRWHLNVAIGVPTGSIGESDTVLTPMNTRPAVRLPYAMQIGSGTFDLKPGLTYRGRARNWSWGAQALGVVRLGNNDAGYALGDRIEGTAWLAYDVTRTLSVSTRVKAASQGDIEGADAAVVGPVQTADPDNYGGDVVEALFGVNHLFTGGPLAGNRLAVEGGVPLRRDLNGPQLETDWMLTVGWQRAF